MEKLVYEEMCIIVDPGRLFPASGHNGNYRSSNSIFKNDRVLVEKVSLCFISVEFHLKEEVFASWLV